MRQAVDSVFKGLFLILLGIVFFANMYGFLPWNFWINVLDLWPLLLIIAGIALFFNKRIPFSAVLLMFLLGLVVYSFIQSSSSMEYRSPLVNGTGKVMEISTPLVKDVEKVDFTLNLGSVSMNLRGVDSNANQLLQGTYEWKSRGNLGDPEYNYKTNGDTAEIKFNSEKKASAAGNKLVLNLSDQIFYDKVKLNAGAVSGIMDFSLLQIKDLDISTGASDIELRFGDTGGQTKVNLSTGAAKLSVVIPESVGLKFDISGIASETNFSGDGLILSNKDWVSPNYEQAKTKVEMKISMAAGKIDLERIEGVESGQSDESSQTKTW